VSFGKVIFPIKQLYVVEHTTYFSLKTLRRLLEGEGFRMLKSWKTETDLKRYRFSRVMRPLLRIGFFVARLTNFQNRVIIFAARG